LEATPVGIYVGQSLDYSRFMQERRLGRSSGTWRCAIGGATSAEEALKGRDPQLERAVQEALNLLAQNATKHVARPAPIDGASKKP
jgi:hypothetical protein